MAILKIGSAQYRVSGTVAGAVGLLFMAAFISMVAVCIALLIGVSKALAYFVGGPALIWGIIVVVLLMELKTDKGSFALLPSFARGVLGLALLATLAAYLVQAQNWPLWLVAGGWMLLVSYGLAQRIRRLTAKQRKSV